ncbi:MAG: hypothetical protein R3B84_24640 [Zavarzinella sp.]
MIYKIQSSPPAYYTGKRIDGKQYLFGQVENFIAFISFDNTGNLLEFTKYNASVDLSHGLGPYIEQIVTIDIKRISESLAVVEAPINIALFFLADWNVGLKLFPIDLEDFLGQPEEYSDDDALIFRKDIDDWLKNRYSVLHWGNNYLLGRDGLTL